MMNQADTIYEFEGYWRCKSKCGLHIYHNNDNVIVILTELGDNKGASVTNSVELIVQSLLNDNLIHLSDHLTFVEHYPEHGSGHYKYDETYDLIDFQIKTGKHFAGPKWIRLSKEQVEKMIGEKL